MGDRSNWDFEEFIERIWGEERDGIDGMILLLVGTWVLSLTKYINAFDHVSNLTLNILILYKITFKNYKYIGEL